MDWFRRFMYGRYGMDQMCWGLLIFSLVMVFLARLTNFELFSLLGFAGLVWCYYRMFSRSIYQRQAENRKFMELADPFLKRFQGTARQMQDREHRYYRCPFCAQKVRVPKGRGKIQITCPSCHYTFVKKT